MDNLDYARTAAVQGDKKKARKFLREYLKENPRSDDAWLLFALVAESVSDEITCLKRALKINPNNAEAKDRLEKIRHAYHAAPVSNPAPQPAVAVTPVPESIALPATSGGTSSIAVVLTLIILACFGCWIFSTVFRGPTSNLPSSNFGATTYGDFKVPGSAYMDGRDVSAGLTLMTMNIWDTVEMSRVSCELEHGDFVTILEATKSGGRNYFHVSSGSCEGWVVERSLSTTYHSPVGDRLP